MSIQAQTTRIEIGEAFAYGWRKLMANAGPWMLLTLAGLVAGSLLGWLSELARNTPLALLFGLANFVVVNVIAFALITMAVDAVHGRAVRVPDVRDRVDAVVAYLVATFLYGVAIAFGLVLLIVPGIIFLVAFYFYGYAIVDEGADPVTALRRSRELTRGRRGRLFLAGLVAVGVNILGGMAFGIGIVLSYPITVLAAAHVYRQLRGEPAAE